MIAGLIEYLEGVIETFGVWGVFVAAFVEEIVAPLPSPVVMMTGGFFLLEGPVNPEFFFILVFLIAVPYAFGVTLGSLVLYGLVYVFGESAVKKWGRWFGISWDNVERLQGRLRRSWWDGVVLFGLRVVPIVPSAALAALCGFIRMRFITYSLITFVGVGIRATLFAFLGWYAGEAYYQYAERISEIETYVVFGVLLVVILIVVYILVRTQARRRQYGTIDT